MSLIEDYLRAVAVLLPKAQRDDIIAELRDTVLTRIEAREAELGRPLSDDEVEAVLRTIGHPITVAAGYGEGPRHAVGPTLYPYWAFAVKVAVTLQIAIAVVVMLIRTVATGDIGLALGQAMSSILNGALILIGIATAACWLIERRVLKLDYGQTWRVRDLRPLQFVAWDWWDWSAAREAFADKGSGRRGSRSRAERTRAWRRKRVGAGVAGVVVGALMLAWWTRLLPITIISGPQEAHRLDLELGPLASIDWGGLRDAIWAPVALWCLLVIARGATLIARPAASRVSGAFDIGQGLVALGVAEWLWFSSPVGPLIRVDSIAGFFIRMKEGLFHAAPVDPTAVLTLGVVIAAIAGLSRTVQGLALVILGRPSWMTATLEDRAQAT